MCEACREPRWFFLRWRNARRRKPPPRRDWDRCLRKGAVFTRGFAEFYGASWCKKKTQRNSRSRRVEWNCRRLLLIRIGADVYLTRLEWAITSRTLRWSSSDLSAVSRKLERVGSRIENTEKRKLRFWKRMHENDEKMHVHARALRSISANLVMAPRRGEVRCNASWRATSLIPYLRKSKRKIKGIVKQESGIKL